MCNFLLLVSGMYGLDNFGHVRYLLGCLNLVTHLHLVYVMELALLPGAICIMPLDVAKASLACLAALQLFRVSRA